MKTSIWLMGGLGNNLFQLNYGLFLKEHYNLDVDFVQYLTKKNLLTRLARWKIHANFVEELYPSLPFSVGRLGAAPLIARTDFFNSYSRFVGVKARMDQPTRNLFGYFQFGKGEIPLSPHLLIPLESEITKRVDKFDFCVHLRFRDNNWLKESVDFYRNTLAKIYNKKLLICTDDRDSANRMMSETGVHNFLISDGSALDDFRLLMHSKNLCLSPSSFSWWACSLNTRKENVLFPDIIKKEFGNFY